MDVAEARDKVASGKKERTKAGKERRDGSRIEKEEEEIQEARDTEVSRRERR